MSRKSSLREISNQENARSSLGAGAQSSLANGRSSLENERSSQGNARSSQGRAQSGFQNPKRSDSERPEARRIGGLPGIRSVSIRRIMGQVVNMESSFYSDEEDGFNLGPGLQGGPVKVIRRFVLPVIRERLM